VLTVDLARLGIKPGDMVLDLGCGGGRHAFACLRLGALVVALDSDEVELKGVAGAARTMEESGEAEKGSSLQAIRASALELPLASGSFDAVVAAEVLEHIADDSAALGELARILKPGGILAVTVPSYLPEAVNWVLSRRYHEVEGGHIRIYRSSQLKERLLACGLAISGQHHAHALHSPYWWLRCLVGVDNEENKLVRAYHGLLVRLIFRPSPAWRLLERMLDPLIGKSLVVYAWRPA
jgi:SAM-dependent methyltransferase